MVRLGAVRSLTGMMITSAVAGASHQYSGVTEWCSRCDSNRHPGRRQHTSQLVVHWALRLVTHSGLTMETISLHLPDDLIQRLERQATVAGRSRSMLIREVLESYLRECERQCLLAAFAVEAGQLSPTESVALAEEFAEAEAEALERAEGVR